MLYPVLNLFRPTSCKIIIFLSSPFFQVLGQRSSICRRRIEGVNRQRKQSFQSSPISLFSPHYILPLPHPFPGLRPKKLYLPTTLQRRSPAPTSTNFPLTPLTVPTPHEVIILLLYPPSLPHFPTGFRPKKLYLPTTLRRRQPAAEAIFSIFTNPRQISFSVPLLPSNSPPMLRPSPLPLPPPLPPSPAAAATPNQAAAATTDDP